MIGNSDLYFVNKIILIEYFKQPTGLTRFTYPIIFCKSLKRCC